MAKTRLPLSPPAPDTGCLPFPSHPTSTNGPLAEALPQEAQMRRVYQEEGRRWAE